ncbi:unnamed protein product, partial [Iphiclides podalirius]
MRAKPWVTTEIETRTDKPAGAFCAREQFEEHTLLPKHGNSCRLTPVQLARVFSTVQLALPALLYKIFAVDLARRAIAQAPRTGCAVRPSLSSMLAVPEEDKLTQLNNNRTEIETMTKKSEEAFSAPEHFEYHALRAQARQLLSTNAGPATPRFLECAALVHVVSDSDQQHHARILLDKGSASNFIVQDL